MLKKRIFNVVLIDENNGTGVEQANKFNKIVHYDNKALKVIVTD